MSHFPEGRAVVYCQGAFGTPNGKTAHGLVRDTERYEVVAVIDARHRGRDALEVLDGKRSGIPIFGDLQEALDALPSGARRPTHFVVGLAPDGGRLSPDAKEDVRNALESGLNVDSGLHDFLSEDRELAALARAMEVSIRDVRRPPSRSNLHAFSGRIDDVGSRRIAVLGTDSACGKRTTALALVRALRQLGENAELIGTGQTSWMQGVRYGIVLDSLVNDFVAGEIEHACWRAWTETRPETLVLEGQGSLLNPAYPGGFELLAAGRPHAIVLQHVPARREYDGFPGFVLHPLARQIEAVELIGGRPVVAITISHEGLATDEVHDELKRIRQETGLPAFDVLLEGAEGLARVLPEVSPSMQGNKP